MISYCDRALVRTPYRYALCTDEKSFQKELKRLGMPQSEWPPFLNPGAHATIHEFVNGDGDCCALVCLGSCKGRSTEEVHGLLTHEAMHLWRWTREALGEKAPSSEFEAYAIQNITQNLMEAWKMSRKRVDK